MDCDVKDLLATGKPVLVDEEFVIEKHQKFKVGHSTYKPAIVDKSHTVVVGDDTRLNKKAVLPKLRVSNKPNETTLRPIVLAPVKPVYTVAHNDKDSHQIAKVGRVQLADKANDKEIVLASYRVVIPIFIPKVMVPINQRNIKYKNEGSQTKDQKIKYVETKSTKMVPIQRNVTYIEEIYKPELIPQKVITDYVVRDPNNKNQEKVVKTVVKDITEAPFKL